MFRSFADVISTNVKNAKQTLSMSVIELKKTYSSSTLGIVWALIKPTLFVLVYWFGIQFGIRGGKGDEGEPFLLWLVERYIRLLVVIAQLKACNNRIV